MQELIHIGNFKEIKNKSRVFTGAEAKLFIGGKEVAMCSNFVNDAFRGQVDFENVHVIGQMEPAEIIPPNGSIEFTCTNFKIAEDIDPSDFMGLPKIAEDTIAEQITRALTEDIEQCLFGGGTPEVEDLSIAGLSSVTHKEGAFTLETLQEVHQKILGAFGVPEELLIPFQTFKALELDIDSLEVEIEGNEMHVGINAMFPKSDVKPPGGDVGPQEVKTSREMIHIGNFRQVDHANEEVISRHHFPYFGQERIDVDDFNSLESSCDRAFTLDEEDPAPSPEEMTYKIYRI